MFWEEGFCILSLGSGFVARRLCSTRLLDPAKPAGTAPLKFVANTALAGRYNKKGSRNFSSLIYCLVLNTLHHDQLPAVLKITSAGWACAPRRCHQALLIWSRGMSQKAGLWPTSLAVALHPAVGHALCERLPWNLIYMGY